MRKTSLTITDVALFHSARWIYKNQTFTIFSINDRDVDIQLTGTTAVLRLIDPDEIKPLLRPLNTMTIEEFAEFTKEPSYTETYCALTINRISKSLFELHRFISHNGHFDSIPWLLRNNFDIFWWIEDGLAYPQSKFEVKPLNS